MGRTSDSETTAIRRRILFSGRVQGVGFRYTTEAVAARFNVTGFVRNLRDGRVELVAEGEPAELTRFEHAVADTMRHYITDASATDAPATGEFASFGITF